jgi:hypothetical protein
MPFAHGAMHHRIDPEQLTKVQTVYGQSPPVPIYKIARRISEQTRSRVPARKPDPGKRALRIGASHIPGRMRLRTLPATLFPESLLCPKAPSRSDSLRRRYAPEDGTGRLEVRSQTLFEQTTNRLASSHLHNSVARIEAVMTLLVVRSCVVESIEQKSSALSLLITADATLFISLNRCFRSAS